MGFKAITVLHEFYEDTPEDAYLMQYRYRPSAAELNSSSDSERRAA
jgi:ribosomal-protein-alanine N-acetyltransferase